MMDVFETREKRKMNGGVVQGIEHRITNPVVASSKLVPAIIL
jgi:hypothetical protein